METTRCLPTKKFATEIIKVVTNLATRKQFTLEFTTRTESWNRVAIDQCVKDRFCEAVEKEMGNLPVDAAVAVLT